MSRLRRRMPRRPHLRQRNDQRATEVARLPRGTRGEMLGLHQKNGKNGGFTPKNWERWWSNTEKSTKITPKIGNNDGFDHKKVVKCTERWARNGLFNIPKTICWNCGLDEYMIYVSYRVYDPQKLMKNLDISGMSWGQHPWVGNGYQRLASCGLFYTKVRLGYKLLTSPIRFILRVPTNSGHSGHSTWRDWSKLIQRHVKDMNKFMEIWNIYEYLQIHILNSFAWLGIDGIWTILGIIKDY